MPNIVEILVSAKSTTMHTWAKEKAQAGKAGAETGSSFSAGFQRTMRTAATIGAGVFVAGLIGSVKAGEKLQTSQESLSRALLHTHSSMASVSGALDATRKKMESYGFTNEEVNTSIAKLTNVTGSAKIAIGLEQATADLAAKKHVDLASATMLVSRAAVGNTRSLREMNVTFATGITWEKATESAQKILADRIRESGGVAKFAAQNHMSLGKAEQLVKEATAGSIPALNKLGIDVLPKSATAAQRMAEFTRIMNAKLGGEAAAAAETSAGKMRVLRARLTDASAAIGEKLLPYIDKFVTFVSGHINDIVRFAAVFGGLMVATKVASAIRAVAVSLGLMDAAMDANPIGAIIVAIEALAVAFYMAWQKSATFRDIIKKIGIVFLDFGEIFVKVAKFIIDYWLTIVGVIVHGAASAFGWIPGIGPKLKSAAKHFDDFRKGVDGAFNKTIDTMENWKKKLNESIDQSGKARKRIVGDFDRQGQAATAAKADLAAYSGAIKTNGVWSGEAERSRKILINDMIKAGVNANTARSDVKKYSDAIANNGAQSDQARRARRKLVDDIYDAFKNSQQGRKDINRLTDAVQNHSHDSDAVRSARRRLITDLENTGVDAKTAKRLVDLLQQSINRMHGKSATVKVIGTGAGQIHVTAAGLGAGKFASLNLYGRQRGGKVEEGTTPTADDVLVRVSKDETVVSAAHSRQLAPAFRAVGVPGYAAGGLPGRIGQIVPWATQQEASWLGRVEKAWLSGVVKRAEAVAKSMSSGYGGPPGSGPLQAYAKRLLALRGWANQWPSFNNLVMGESGWNVYATNPSSAAYGIPQALPGSKMAAAGPDWRTSGYTQLRWMMGYIASVYGNPFRAFAMWMMRSPHWYGRGTHSAMPGLAMVGERGAELVQFRGGERVTPVRGGVTINVSLSNYGVIGSKVELENWLTRSLDSLRRQGRLPRVS